jgi:hypothetical protein
VPYTIAGAKSHGMHRVPRNSTMRTLISRIAVRRLAAVLVAFAATLGILAAVGLVHANGLGDYAVGTDTAYCGMYMQSHQVSFYCQSGH